DWLVGSMTFFLLLVGILGFHYRTAIALRIPPFIVWLSQRMNQIQHHLIQFFSLNWMIDGFLLIYKGLKPLANFFEGVLEGESGLLWALVLLALLLSLVNASGISP
ncbi:MAG: hypothetical protein N3A60_12850, partial [Thermanaerothrix sp.]|nr:hypothetical protein [Thermanaerothrix sp.]